MLMWRAVVGAGLDLLALDLDFELHANPVAQFHALTAPGKCNGTSEGGCRAPPDVVAAYDGPRYKLLNVGNIWIRSTPDTKALVERVANRTWLGWDQLLLTEEVGFNKAFDNVGCCHTRCFRAVGKKGVEVLEKTRDGYRRRHKLEGGADICEQRQPNSALGPPAGSRYKWHWHICYRCPRNTTRGWSVDNYNALSENYLRYGRCSYPSHSCEGWSNCTS